MFDVDNPDFEPSGQTKSFMRYLRKKSRNIAGIQHPGLFGFHGFTVDATLFLVLLVLEIIGLRALWVSLSDNTDQSGFAILLMIVAAFLVDILFAVLHHLYHTGKNSELSFKIALAEEDHLEEGGDTPAVRKANAENELSGRRRIAGVFAVILVLLSFLKIGAFLTFTPDAMDEPGQVLFIAVAYVLVAILHVTVTGYFLFTLYFDFFLWRPDYRRFLKGVDCHAQRREQRLDHHNDFDQLDKDGHKRPLTVKEHHLDTNGLDKEPRVATLTAKGILSDDAVLAFAQKVHEPVAKREIALKGMRLQLSILQAN